MPPPVEQLDGRPLSDPCNALSAALDTRGLADEYILHVARQFTLGGLDIHDMVRFTRRLAQVSLGAQAVAIRIKEYGA